MSYRQTIEVLVGASADREQYIRTRALQGALIVNDQTVVKAFHGRASLRDRRLADNYRRAQHTITMEALKSGRDVIIDRANLSQKARKRYVKLGRECGLQVVAVTFPGVMSHQAPTTDEGFHVVCPIFVATEITAKGGW